MQRTLSDRPLINARPFLKWAGGKTQLLDELVKRLPAEITASGVIENYVEPFVGGGAVFFYLKSRFEVKKSLSIGCQPRAGRWLYCLAAEPCRFDKTIKIA